MHKKIVIPSEGIAAQAAIMQSRDLRFDTNVFG